MLYRILLLIVLSVPTAFAQTKSKVTVMDLTRIRQVGGIKLAPDGQRALYTLQTIEPGTGDLKDDYDCRTHLYLTNLKPGDAKALTHGSESVRQAVWSPDGRPRKLVGHAE